MIAIKKTKSISGSFGKPLNRLQSLSLTEEEFRGLKKISKDGSSSAALRRIVGPIVLEYLARVGTGEIETDQQFCEST